MKKKVLIVLETGWQPGRAQLIGILRGINAGRLDWELDIVPSRRKVTAATVKRALGDGTDGVILAHPARPGVPEQLQRQGKPTVFMDVLSRSDMPAVPTSRHLRVDDAAIGCAAARHFLSHDNRAPPRSPMQDAEGGDRPTARADLRLRVRQRRPRRAPLQEALRTLHVRLPKGKRKHRCG